MMPTHGTETLLSSVILVSMTTLAVALVGSRVLRRNRRLFWCLGAALLLHATALTGLWHIGVGGQSLVATPQPPRIMIEPFHPAPKPKPPEPLVIPSGVPDGDRSAKTPPQGDSAQENTHNQPPPPLHVMTHDGPVDVQLPPAAPNMPDDGTTFTEDMTRFAHNVTGPNGPGYGTPTGVPGGPPQCGIGPPRLKSGKVYFIRFKCGTGAWNAYTEGTQHLLDFTNRYVTCEATTRAMGYDEVRALLDAGTPPAFIYLYVDESFVLTGEEVRVLQRYLNTDGFLFLDSRPDADVRERVTNELARVLPGAPLRALPASHTVNRFFFRLSPPAVGENIADRQNYGITRRNRLQVFYTMGNLAHLFAGHAPDEMSYITAQYQQGVNVIFYAIRKGDDTGVDARHGAGTALSTGTLDRVFSLGEPPHAATPSVKVHRDPPPAFGAPPPPGVPDDVNVLP